jgi:hypothetical protein
MGATDFPGDGHDQPHHFYSIYMKLCSYCLLRSYMDAEKGYEGKAQGLGLAE